MHINLLIKGEEVYENNILLKWQNQIANSAL